MIDEEGELLVRIARAVVEGNPNFPKDLKLNEKRGVFVTLNKQVGSELELRGCIGFPLATLPLKDALVQAAMSAAREDPRFPPVRKEELEKIIVEVSVLTEPKEIQVNSPLEYPKKVQVGVDGLIVKWDRGTGLLLPQVAVEQHWDSEEFLSNTCMKAGAPPDGWLRSDVKIYKFQGEVFGEETPRGKVVRKQLV